ncbi:hypothetical protein EV424DRAFT_1335759, partial [Suillus variegatus]
NHPNISLIVKKMKFLCNIMHDLIQVLDMRLRDVNPPPKFMIFTNSCTLVEMTCNRLCLDMPGHLQGKIIWFHSRMSMEFHVDTMKKVQTHYGVRNI